MSTVEQRLRAGVLEQGTVDLLSEIGAGERLAREGIVHHGVELQFDGERHRIPLSELTGGATIVIYGQTEVVKDLIALRLEQGDPLVFEAEDVALWDLDGEQPRISYRHDGQRSHAALRRDRRLRRLPRRLAAVDPRGGAEVG